jgi:ribosomal protein L7/L12
MAHQDEFNLIIESVDATDPAASAKRFAEAFGLDPELTQAMLSKTLPVLFVTRLTKREVKAILPKLEELSRNGLEFRITAETPKIAKVNWLKRPDFSAAGSGSNSITFDWQDTAFVCPSCGDTFLFKRIGPGLPVSRVESAPPAPAKAVEPEAPAPAPAPIKITIPPPAAARPPEKEPEPEPEPAPAAADPAPAPAINLQLEGDEDESPSLPPDFEGSDEVVPLDDLPPAKQSTELEAPVVQQGPISAALEEGAGVAIQPTGAAGESYNVFVPEVKDVQKREEVVKLISEIRDCSPDEARKLTRRIMIPVAKNVPRDKAEKILSEFRRLKITGRMTKASRDE